MYSMASRGKSVRIINLPKPLRAKFRRAILFSGASSQSEWLVSRARLLILEIEKEHGDLMKILTPDEDQIVRAVADGAAEVQHIAEETMIARSKVEAILAELVERKILEIRRKGGKTTGARGAVIDLYFVCGK